MKRIDGLDALRGYAALIILMGHVVGHLGMPYLRGGYLAVDLFFVISGYVIGYAYDARMPSLGFVGFARVRLIRFYPLYLVGTLLGLSLYLVYLCFGKDTAYSLSQLLAFGLLPNLAFLPMLNSAFGQELYMDVPAWSLFFELLVNFVFALFFPWLRRGVLIAIVAVSGAALVYVGSRHSGLLMNTAQDTLSAGLARVGFSFPLGLLLYRDRDFLPRLGMLGPAVPIAMLIFFWPANSAWRDLLVVVVVAPVFVLIASDAKPVLPRVGSFLAEISYCLYIVHEPIVSLTTALSNRWGINPSLLMGLAVPALIVVSYQLDRLYDRPVRKWLGTRFPSVKTRLVPAS